MISRTNPHRAPLSMDEFLAKRFMPDNLCKRPLMQNDLLRSLYGTMLLLWPVELILEFWNRLPLESAGRTLTGAELFRHIWDTSKAAPKEYVARVMWCIEFFLVQHGMDVQKFMDTVVFRINDGTPVSAPTLTRWIMSKVHSIYTAKDLRVKVLELMADTTEKFIPGSYREVLRVEKQDDVRTAWCLWAPDKNLNIKWTYHSELFGLKMLTNAPRVLGLPPFERVDDLAETGCVEHILWDCEMRVEGDRLLIDGEDHGRRIPFQEHCRKLDVDLDHLFPPDWTVNLIHKPYHCPLRRREVLHVGCAYDAPVWIGKVRFPRHQPDNTAALTHLLSDIVESKAELQERLEAKHACLLDSLIEKAVFTYTAGENIMELNSKVLIRGVPAELLSYMLRAHRDSGKTRFLLADFKRDTGILNRRNPNLEAFLEKLRVRLTDRFHRMRIVIEPGVRILQMDCPVIFKET